MKILGSNHGDGNSFCEERLTDYVGENALSMHELVELVGIGNLQRIPRCCFHNFFKKQSSIGRQTGTKPHFTWLIITSH